MNPPGGSGQEPGTSHPYTQFLFSWQGPASCELHSAALSSMTGLKHIPLTDSSQRNRVLLPEEVSQNLPLVSSLFFSHYS